MATRKVILIDISNFPRVMKDVGVLQGEPSCCWNTGMQVWNVNPMGKLGTATGWGHSQMSSPRLPHGMDTKSNRTNAGDQGISGDFPTGIHPPAQISAELFPVKTQLMVGKENPVIPSNAFVSEIISHPEGV